MYVYVPVGSERLGKQPCSSPAILVYGDGAYTADSAKAEATGLADIAYEEGAPIVFANPSDGKAWTRWRRDVSIFTPQARERIL